MFNKVISSLFSFYFFSVFVYRIMLQILLGWVVCRNYKTVNLLSKYDLEFTNYSVMELK